MADDDDVNLVTGNDDLRAAGLVPDDEDDIQADAAALLGIDLTFAPVDLSSNPTNAGGGPATATDMDVRWNSTYLMLKHLVPYKTVFSVFINSHYESQLSSFDILLWWRDHKLTYPVLSIMARDIMSVPVSTVSSESCFSLTGRIIEERRRRLLPENVEMLTCLKDWELGEKREQHAVDNPELEDSFQNLFLDEDEPVAA